MEHTKKVAGFVVETRYETIPPKAIETAKAAMLDCLGVALAGSREASSRICARLVDEEKADGRATLWGHGLRSSPANAAFANGVSAHALDYDHSFTMMGQPTAGLIPALLALAEALGANGRELLEAYVAGFEVTAKLVSSMPEHSNEGGWHSVATLGSLGAAAACAKLLKLEAAKVRTALGVASSMAGGMVANFGTMTKPLHAGLAARNGIVAAGLSEKDFTANSQILEGPIGLFGVYSRGLPCDPAPLNSLGISWELVESGIKIKAYPCGGLTHSAIDAALELRSQHRINADSVDSVRAEVTERTFERIIYRIPESGLQGKFSMPYILARALMDGKVTPDSFTDEAARDPSVLSLAARIDMAPNPQMKENAAGSRPCRVTIRLKDGRTFSHSVDYPRGSSQAPLSLEDVRAKFVGCAARVLSKDAVEHALEYLDRLERLENVRSLCKLLGGGASS